MAKGVSQLKWDELIVPLCTKLFVHWTPKGKTTWLKRFLECKDNILHHEERYDQFYVAFCLLSADFLTGFERGAMLPEQDLDLYKEAYEVLMKYFINRLPKGAVKVHVPSALLDPYQVWHKSTVTLPPKGEKCADKAMTPGPLQQQQFRISEESDVGICSGEQTPSQNTGSLDTSKRSSLILDTSPDEMDSGNISPNVPDVLTETEKLLAETLEQLGTDCTIEPAETAPRFKSKYETTHSWMNLHARVMCLRYEMNTVVSRQVVSPYPIKSFREYDDGQDKEINIPSTSFLQALRALCSGGSLGVFAVPINLRFCLPYALRCVDVPDFIVLPRPKCGEPILPAYEWKVISYPTERSDGDTTTPWKGAEADWDRLDCIFNQDCRVNLGRYERGKETDYTRCKSVLGALSGTANKFAAGQPSRILDESLSNEVFKKFVTCFNSLIEGREVKLPEPEENELPALLDGMDSALGLMELLAFHEMKEVSSQTKNILLRYAIVGVAIALHVLPLGKHTVLETEGEGLHAEPALSDAQIRYKSLVNKGLQFYALALKVFKDANVMEYDLQYFSVLLLAPNLYGYMRALFNENLTAAEDSDKVELGKFEAVASNFTEALYSDRVLKGTSFLLWPLGLQLLAILDEMIVKIRTRHAQQAYDTLSEPFANTKLCSERRSDYCMPQMIAHVMRTCPLYNLLFMLISAGYCKGAHLTKKFKDTISGVFTEQLRISEKEEIKEGKREVEKAIDLLGYQGDLDLFDYKKYMIFKRTNRMKSMRGEPYACEHCSDRCDGAASEPLPSDEVNSLRWQDFVKKRKSTESVASSAHSVEYRVNAVYDPSTPVWGRREFQEELDLDKISYFSGDGDDNMILGGAADNELVIFKKDVALPRQFLKLCSRALTVLGKFVGAVHPVDETETPRSLYNFKPFNEHFPSELEAEAFIGIADSLDKIAPAEIDQAVLSYYAEVSNALGGTMQAVWSAELMKRTSDSVMDRLGLCLIRMACDGKPLHLAERPRITSVLCYYVMQRDCGYEPLGLWEAVVKSLQLMATSDPEPPLKDILPVNCARILLHCFITKMQLFQKQSALESLVKALVASTSGQRHATSSAAILAIGRLMLLMLTVLRNFGKEECSEDLLTIVEASHSLEQFQAVPTTDYKLLTENDTGPSSDGSPLEMPRLGRLLQYIYKVDLRTKEKLTSQKRLRDAEEYKIMNEAEDRINSAYESELSDVKESAIEARDSALAKLNDDYVKDAKRAAEKVKERLSLKKVAKMSLRTYYRQKILDSGKESAQLLPEEVSDVDEADLTDEEEDDVSDVEEDVFRPSQPSGAGPAKTSRKCPPRIFYHLTSLEFDCTWSPELSQGAAQIIERIPVWIDDLMHALNQLVVSYRQSALRVSLSKEEKMAGRGHDDLEAKLKKATKKAMNAGKNRDLVLCKAYGYALAASLHKTLRMLMQKTYE